MEQFLRQLNTIPEIADLSERAEHGGCPAAVHGLQPVQQACVGAAVAHAAGRPAVFICAGESEARRMAMDVEALTGTAPVFLPAREWNLRPGDISSRGWEQERLAALYRMATEEPRAVVTTADALNTFTISPILLKSLTVILECGGRADLRKLTDGLLRAGYTRCEQVEGVG